MTHEISKKIKMLPMRYAIFYLYSTFIIFIFSDFAEQTDNLGEEFLFIFSAYSLFYFGYIFGVNTKSNVCYKNIKYNESKYINHIIVFGSFYFYAWAVNQIVDFGGGSISDVFYNILNPGSSYKAKFEIYEILQDTGAVNRVTQILILLSYITAIFIPLLVFYWKSISRWLRLFAVCSVLLYVISFLYIGTQKGIGDVVIFTVVGLSVYLCSQSEVNKSTKRKLVLGFSLMMVSVVIYMSIAQSSRANEFGVQDTLLYGDVSKTWIAQIFGTQSALGFYSILGYPSHGYAGLAYNLKQDFVFSNGAGFSQAVESYRLQYLGGSQNFYLTYPARTEMATGWPAGLYWATAFPWFASDLTFAGAALLMFFIGFLFARSWLKCISKQDVLAFAIFGQLVIFIAYLPANNQILMSRQGVWIVISIVVIGLARSLRKGNI